MAKLITAAIGVRVVREMCGDDVTVDAIRKAVVRGELPRVPIEGRGLVLREADVRRWAAVRRTRKPAA